MRVYSIVAVGLPLAATATAFITLFAVLWGASDGRLARTIACFSAVIGLWNLAVGLQAIEGATTLMPGFLRLLRYPFVLLPAVSLHMVIQCSGRSSRRISLLIASGYALAAIFAVVNYRGLLLLDWSHHAFGVWARPGPLYPLFVAFCATWLVAMPAYAWWALRLPLEPTIRLRMRYFALACFVGVPLGLTNFLPNYGIEFPPLGSLASILIVAVLGYGALRHRMLDIDAVVLKVAASLTAATIVVIPLLVALVLLERSELGRPNLAVTIAFGCALLLSLWFHSHARDAIGRTIERSFFPNRHQGRRAIERLSREIIELTHRERLGQELTATLGQGLGLVATALYVRSDAGELRCAAAWGEAVGEASTGWELRLPIGSGDDPLGQIALGPKRSGAAIDDLDLTLLAVVAAQVAVALKNIDYVREIEAQTRAIESQKAEIEELKRSIEEENTLLRAEVRSVSGFGEIVGSSPALQRVLELVGKAARSDASILITGETGTGKELIARAIHELSERRSGPLISVNCPAIPPELAEAELFGCERGAFTGAESRPGRFELAHGGTIFLDEVGDLPYAIQTKLLRVLQDREVQRLGALRARRVDVRIVSATNRPLRRAMAEGGFRADLYHRLATIVADLPPLRERIGDIEMLATYFLDRAARTYQKPITGFSAGAMSTLRNYNWPGNIRELQNVVERAALLCGGETIVPEHLGDLRIVRPDQVDSLSSSLRGEKERRVREALHASGGSIAGAARLLGVSRSNLSRLMKSLGLQRPNQVQ